MKTSRDGDSTTSLGRLILSFQVLKKWLCEFKKKHNLGKQNLNSTLVAILSVKNNSDVQHIYVC